MGAKAIKVGSWFILVKCAVGNPSLIEGNAARLATNIPPAFDNFSILYCINFNS